MKKLAIPLIGLLGLSLSGCQNYEAKNANQRVANSYSEALKNQKLNATEERNKKILSKYDSTNPYMKTVKKNGRLYQDGIEVPAPLLLGTLAYQKQVNTNLKNAKKLLAQPLSNDGKKSYQTVNQYVNAYLLLQPTTYQDTVKFVTQLGVDNPTTMIDDTDDVYGQQAFYYTLQKFGLNQVLTMDDTQLKSALQKAGYRNVDITYAMNKITAIQAIK